MIATDLQATIVIATFNRANYLSLCLEGIASLATDPASFEVIVVDNNSTDNTPTVISHFSSSHQQLTVRYLPEPLQGASRARNRGIQASQGAIICFLDDDAVPDVDWLDNVLDAFSDERIGCVGGPATLDFMGREVPPWLNGDLKGLLSGYGLRYDKPTVLTSVGEYPFLCNMAIRKSVLDRVGLFNIELGPNGNNLVVGEETELMERIRRHRWEVLYLPSARVRHLVAPERLEKQYIYRTGRRLAVTHVVLTWSQRWVSILRWIASDFWYAFRRFLWLVWALLRRNPLWFDDYMRFWMVGMRIPLRVKALLWGRSTIERA